MSDMNEITEAEKKRLLSLKQKKQAYRAKEQLVRDALKNLDTKSRKNKIVFNENGDEEHSVHQSKSKRKHKDLFDNDDDEDDTLLVNGEFKIKKHVDEKISKLQSRYGNDKRFVLDERFNEADAEDQKKASFQNGDNSEEIKDEKEWQLDILGSVLGQTIAPKSQQVSKSSSKGKMIRYDPTQSEHSVYEIKPEAKTTNGKSKKKVKQMQAEQNQEDNPVPVSKEMFYSVSDKLTQSLQQNGQFSLLKAYGQEDTNTSNNNYESVPLDKNTNSQFKFSTRNPFKYDSSDDENEDVDKSIEKSKSNDTVEETTANNLFASNKFFLKSNDSRFNDALTFFNKSAVSYDGFKELRRELKKIVRAKVRKNLKKNEPWGKKRKVKKRY